MDITLQYFDDCPNWRVAEDRLRQALVGLGRPAEPIRLQRVETPDEADRVGFGGSPTILVGGVDPFADPAGPAGFACRVYDGDAAPTVAQLRAALSGLIALPHCSPGSARVPIITPFSNLAPVDRSLLVDSGVPPAAISEDGVLDSAMMRELGSNVTERTLEPPRAISGDEKRA